MTYAIKRENGDVLWFDAVEGFEETYASSVTKHPIATGSLVSDHIIKDSPVLNLRGILSDADFNLSRPQLGDDYQGWQSVSVKKQYVNNTPVDSPVSINSSVNIFKDFLPESVSQFTNTSIPQVIVKTQPKVKSALSVKNEMINMRDNRELFTIIDFNEGFIRKSWPNVVFTNLSFAEDPDSGDAVLPVMTLEQITLTTLIVTKVVVNKGRQQGITSKRPTKPGDKAKTEPTSLSKQTASDVNPYQYTNPLNKN